eukprot:2797353-Alexandrium_andersonii.AAC.1
MQSQTGAKPERKYECQAAVQQTDTCTCNAAASACKQHKPPSLPEHACDSQGTGGPATPPPQGMACQGRPVWYHTAWGKGRQRKHRQPAR